MKKLSLITLFVCIFTLTGCHHYRHHDNGHGNDGHCPPGQAKKGNC
jgi:hypothetical protein